MEKSAELEEALALAARACRLRDGAAEFRSVIVGDYQMKVAIMRVDEDDPRRGHLKDYRIMLAVNGKAAKKRGVPHSDEDLSRVLGSQEDALDALFRPFAHGGREVPPVFDPELLLATDDVKPGDPIAENHATDKGVRYSFWTIGMNLWR